MAPSGCQMWSHGKSCVICEVDFLLNLFVFWEMHVETVSWSIISELLPAVIGRLKDLLALTVICVQLFLLLWQSLSLMDVDEDASGYLEFIGEFKSLSNVIALIIVLSRMRLLIPYLVFKYFPYIHLFPSKCAQGIILLFYFPLYYLQTGMEFYFTCS
jgi:hypothetical protein